jgi:hypothetical protein
MLELRIDGGFALFREKRGLGANKILAIVRKNGGFDLGSGLSCDRRTAVFVGESKRCA